jgi:hypothetical protein
MRNAIRPFKIPKAALAVAPRRRRKPAILPKPEEVSDRVPWFSVEGLLINGKPVGSVLEWNIAAALDLLKLEYAYQVSVFGGRWVPGGAVIDFEVFLVPRSVYVFAQGDYWHSRGNKEEEDQWLIARIETVLNKQVVEIWEHDALTIQQAMNTLRKELRV